MFLRQKVAAHWLLVATTKKHLLVCLRQSGAQPNRSDISVCGLSIAVIRVSLLKTISLHLVKTIYAAEEI